MKKYMKISLCVLIIYASLTVGVFGEKPEILRDTDDVHLADMTTLEKWASGESDLVLIPENRVCSYKATLTTIDGDVIKVKLKDVTAITPSMYAGWGWNVDGVWEITYLKNTYEIEGRMSYSTISNQMGLLYITELNAMYYPYTPST